MQKAVSLNSGNETGETVASTCLFTARSGRHLGDQNHSASVTNVKHVESVLLAKKQYHSHLGAQRLVVIITHRPVSATAPESQAIADINMHIASFLDTQLCTCRSPCNAVAPVVLDSLGALLHVRCQLHHRCLLVAAQPAYSCTKPHDELLTTLGLGRKRVSP